ncbi:opsin Rh3 isoform X1 [Spodoptera frugiperda]|uniref:Opsin Rh3 isoform X1 n=1 Tax=Spodoptera frugiperda TaxID=7108 RepID=A0A9R0EK57_SPOFR|nr:opsin Rh3 isoform X1 [Spodoptera frugiperda]
MLNILIIALVAASNIVYCMNVDTTRVDKTYTVQLQSDKNKCIYCKIAKIVTLKPFKCHNDFLWRCLDDLKQWKRRRRSSDNFQNEFKNDHKKLKFADFGMNDLTSYHSSVDIVKTTASSVSDNKADLLKKFVKRWPVQRWHAFGLFTDDYLQQINSHWLQFPPPDTRIQYTFGITYIFLAGTGAFGNILVLLMYVRCRTLRTPGNILVANLALSDFLMLAKTPVFIFNSFNLGPALGKTGCVIYGFVGGLTGTTSIATLSAIALDRYWAVVRPLEPLRALTAIRARLLAIGAWLYACVFAIIPALDIGYGRYVPEGYLTSCSFDYLTEDFSPRCFIFVFFCAAWLAPFCTITFCYISIFRVVVFNTSMSYGNQDQRLSTRHVKERTKRKAEIKLAFLVMAVIALFFISWTPYAIVALLGISGKKDVLTPITSMIPALFCKTAACINPFIYIITHPKFRKEFKKLLFRDKSKRMGGTMKTIGYSTDTTRVHRPSKDLSDTDVEIVEMKDIPYRVDEKRELKVKTISSKVAERQDSQTSMSIKSLEDSVVSPPSWYTKPQFSKKKSFHRRSTRTNLSQTSDQED